MRCWGPSYVLLLDLLRFLVVMQRIRHSEGQQSLQYSECCGGCLFLRLIDSSCQEYANRNMSQTIPGLCGLASLSEASSRHSPELCLLFSSPSSLQHR